MLNIVSVDPAYADPRARPTGLGPGDVAYFMTGTHSATYQQGVLTSAIRLESPAGAADAPIVLAVAWWLLLIWKLLQLVLPHPLG